MFSFLTLAIITWNTVNINLLHFIHLMAYIHFKMHVVYYKYVPNGLYNEQE